MPSKTDAWVLFEDKIDITRLEAFIRDQRKGELPRLTMYHVIFSAIVRTFAEVPELNRFVVNSKVYSRNEIKGSMVVMKGMRRDSERSMISPRFQLEDTLPDVVRRIEAETDQIDTTTSSVADDPNKTKFDKAESALGMIPGWMIKIAMWFLRKTDKHGILPKKLHQVSPFHSSFFITHMGSIGLDSVYHHVYEFGTLSIFGAIGRKENYCELNERGEMKRGTRMKLQFVVDERACDGYMYALGFRRIKYLLSHPEILMSPPEKIVFDKIDREK
ncbi:MAG: hypothetical protein J5795_00100 [Lachnospiraceae bacterium]|nr:hypothetical protein [Lachnospiraceae bacterium]